MSKLTPVPVISSIIFSQEMLKIKLPENKYLIKKLIINNYKEKYHPKTTTMYCIIPFYNCIFAIQNYWQ